MAGKGVRAIACIGDRIVATGDQIPLLQDLPTAREVSDQALSLTLNTLNYEFGICVG
jgi:hypothetical protein